MSPSQRVTDAAPIFHLKKMEVIHEGKTTEEKPVITLASTQSVFKHIEVRS